jgi:hypothetical protein
MNVACLCPICNHNQIPAPSRQQISNQNIRSAVGGGYGIAVIVTVLVGGLFSGILPLLLGALLAFAMIVLPAYLVTTVGTDLLFGNNQGYKDYRKNGGSPFWDNFLGNKTEHIVLPNPEPAYGEFVPAGHWKFQCLNCNARVESVKNSCWHCVSNEQRADEWLS